MKRVILLSMFVVLVTVQTLYAGNDLSRAANSGDFALMEKLIKFGEDVNSFDKYGWTALLWSVYYGKIPVAKWLLEHGADPNLKLQKEYGPVPEGTTALILAASYGRDEIVAPLLKKNADPSAVNKDGKKALDYAREFKFNKIIALLQPKK